MLTDQLLSGSTDVRDRAIYRARELARDGDPSGLEALADAIRCLRGTLRCKFYRPRLNVPGPASVAGALLLNLVWNKHLLQVPKSTPAQLAVLPNDLFRPAWDELLRLASNKQLLRSPKTTQGLIALLPIDLFHPLWARVTQVGGDRGSLAFQLLAAHLIVHAEFIIGKARNEREQTEFQDRTKEPRVSCPTCNRSTPQGVLARLGHCHRCEDERKRAVSEMAETSEGFDAFISGVLTEEVAPQEEPPERVKTADQDGYASHPLTEHTLGMGGSTVSITFACACGRKLKAPDSMAGRQGKCPSCGALVSVPADRKAQEKRVLLGDPFKLDFAEERETRTIGWLQQHAPGFDLDAFNRVVTGATTDASAAIKTADDITRQFPDFDTTWYWSAELRIAAGEFEKARHVITQGIPRCKEKSYLYGLMAKTYFEQAARGDMASCSLVHILGWSIKSFLAAQSIQKRPDDMTASFIGEIAKLIGNSSTATLVLQGRATHLDEQAVRTLRQLYREHCTSEQRRKIESYLRDLLDVLMGSERTAKTRSERVLQLAGMTMEEIPKCHGERTRLEGFQRNSQDGMSFFFRCVRCRILTHVDSPGPVDVDELKREWES